jgi:NADH-quinone oxidoreductase subunit G
MSAAEFVVMMTTFRPTEDFTRAAEYAHVWLPLSPFTETDGTFVNVEGRRQEFAQAVSPLGEARPGWKILRMIGLIYGLSGFEQASVTDIRREMNLPDNMTALSQFPHAIEPEDSELSPSPGQLMRLTDVPIYAVDAIVRRAPALQKTADNPKPAARMNAGQIDKLGLKAGSTIEVAAPYGVARLNLLPDNRVPEGCVLIPAGYKETSILGADGPVRVKATS